MGICTLLFLITLTTLNCIKTDLFQSKGQSKPYLLKWNLDGDDANSNKYELVLGLETDVKTWIRYLSFTLYNTVKHVNEKSNCTNYDSDRCSSCLLVRSFNIIRDIILLLQKFCTVGDLQKDSEYSEPIGVEHHHTSPCEHFLQRLLKQKEHI